MIEAEKKSKKNFLVRKNQKFSQLHDAVFYFLIRFLVHIWYPGVSQIKVDLGTSQIDKTPNLCNLQFKKENIR